MLDLLNQLTGAAGSARRITQLTAAALETRLQLFGLELRQEKLRLFALLFWSAVVLLAGFMLAFTVTVAVVWLVPAGARPWVLGGFSLLYAVVLVAAALAVRRRLVDAPPPFEMTVAELKKDRECF